MAGAKFGQKRVKETAEVDVITPHGAEITVGRRRAEALIARAPISFGDGTFRKYVYAGEDNEVTLVAPVTAANPPRKGTGVNSGGE